jgi:3'-phosphoadenosine 5'-phosphosulfate sulfotransferase (PAPS reductase)/FAD synthetase
VSVDDLLKKLGSKTRDARPKPAPGPKPVRPLSDRPVFDWSRCREQGDTIGLSFSNGKDSLALWLYCLEQGFKVVPFYLSICPGLKFIDDSLDDYERFFGTKIYRLLHPNMYMYLNNKNGQPLPRHTALIGMFFGKRAEIPLFNYADVEAGFRRTAELHARTWIATGVRLSDSAARKKSIGTGYDEKRRVVKPLRNFSTDDVITILNDYDCPLPVDYRMFGRSFDGIDPRFSEPIRKYYPDDYKTLCEWYPDVVHQSARLAVCQSHDRLTQPRKVKVSE